MTDLVGEPKGIPFLVVQAGDTDVRWLPVDRPIDIEVMGMSFFNRGGRYCMSEMQDGTVSIWAVVKRLDGEPHLIVPHVTVMRLLLPYEIDKMVRESVRKLDELQ